MKHARKLASVLLALLIVFSLAAPAFAAGNGEIILDNPIAGETYTAHKIFDVVYDTTITNYAYSINSVNEWFATVQAYAADAANGLTLTATAADPNLYIVETGTAFSALNFANALKAAASSMQNGIELTTSGTGVAATGLDLGYYFVTSTNGALCNLTTTNPTVTIHDKNEVIFIKETPEDTVEVGQTVPFTVTTKVRETEGFTAYVYDISDSMSAGLTFDKNVTITLAGETMSTDFYTLEYYDEDNDGNTNNGFKLSFKMIELDNAGHYDKEIVVSYSATVNSNAITVIDENNATLVYTTDPDGGTSILTETEQVYSAKIVIDKYAAGSENNGTKLANAKFVLYKQDNGKKLYYKYTDTANSTADTVTWVEIADSAALTTAITNGTITEVTTDAQGAAEFGGLEAGTYYLQETAAPAGYNMLTDVVTVVIDKLTADELAEADPVAVAASLTATAEVANNTGSKLPETGGMGTTIFYILGATLTLGAAVRLITKKRMAA